MREIDDSAFSRSLLNEIENLREMVNKITPENVKYFPDSLMRDVSDLLDIWGDDATINSIKMQKINALIRYLQTSKKEYATKQVVLTNRENTEVEVPSSFDGRNSFVRINLYGKDNQTPFKSLRNYFEKKQGTVDLLEKYLLTVQKNKSSIDITFDTDSEADDTQIEVEIFLWRTK